MGALPCGAAEEQHRESQSQPRQSRTDQQFLALILQLTDEYQLCWWCLKLKEQTQEHIVQQDMTSLDLKIHKNLTSINQDEAEGQTKHTQCN